MLQLYMVQLLGEPEPAHPAYWQAGETGLTVALFADGAPDAEERARSLAKLLRLDVRECSAPTPVPTPAEDSELPEWLQRLHHDGLAFSVRHLATGVE